MKNLFLIVLLGALLVGCEQKPTDSISPKPSAAILLDEVKQSAEAADHLEQKGKIKGGALNPMEAAEYQAAIERLNAARVAAAGNGLAEDAIYAAVAAGREENQKQNGAAYETEKANKREIQDILDRNAILDAKDAADKIARDRADARRIRGQ